MPRRHPRTITLGLAGCAAAIWLLASVPRGQQGERPPSIDGDPSRGRTIIQRAGCGTCHVIPGVRGARGLVGPPLDWMARRAILAGRVANQPEMLVRWIMDPREIDPLTAMPDLGLSREEAQDVAAYLYTLE